MVLILQTWDLFGPADDSHKLTVIQVTQLGHSSHGRVLVCTTLALTQYLWLIEGQRLQDLDFCNRTR